MSAVTVVGAGLIGLSTGIRLAENGHSVRSVTVDEPTATSSMAATGMVGLAFAQPMDRVPGWERATVAEMDTIRASGVAAGVRIERCLLGSRSSDARPRGIDGWPGYRSARSGELPAGFPYRSWLNMTVVDMSRYLPYLADRYRAAGGTIDIGRVESLDDLTSDVVVNCAGIGARALTGDDTLTGQWGMHTVVANPGIDFYFMEGPPGQAEWVAWMPRGDKVLIGGIVDDETDHPTPDIATGTRLHTAAGQVEPRLADAAVLGHTSGIRPARPAVRVEEESRPSGARLIHNYGHGGLGVTLSWGCAADVVALIADETGDRRNGVR
jgi:D-amino-acid oxidase